MLRDFAERAWQRPRRRPPWRRAIHRPKRALYVSSPVGLGHAWRDVAIARELRALHPGLEIDWLAQEPVTHVLERCGERIHPASRQLALESRHIAAEAHGHELNVFQAWRQMDEILLANFMLFHDVATEDPYDLWIGDEAWELDYYLHENPELKTAAYAFLTDFVGWLPMAEGGADEVRLTADYNAEMIEQVERFPRVRDRALFVGNPEDVVPHSFGPGLPRIAPWVDEHFDFTGYALGPGGPEDREALRAELGYAPDERVCVVTVGGSGVGGGLLERVIAAFPEARRLIPGLRMIVVCGPRIGRDVVRRPRGPRAPRLRPRALAPPRRLRHRGRPGRPRHRHGARRRRPAVPLLPARPPLRAEHPRPPPARALRRRTLDGLPRPPRRSASPPRWRASSPSRGRRRRSSATARHAPPPPSRS